jgi:hypothetical protein
MSNSLRALEKGLRYGGSTRALMANGYYNDLIRKKTRPRKTGTRKITSDKLLLSLILSIKAPACLLGPYI